MLYEKVKKLAGKKKISINQLEKDLGFSSSYISKWRTSMPSAENLRKVALYLETTTEDLLRDEREEVK